MKDQGIEGFPRKGRETPEELSIMTAQAAAKDRNKKPEKIGRNESCPCGSGKKYKKCHGMNQH